MSSRSGEEGYDVFLSYSRRDERAVEQIARRLREKNLHPFFDRWHLVPGENWQEALETALDRSSCCAVFLGRGGLTPWQNEEVRSALEDRARDNSFRVIPVLLPGADEGDPGALPRFLRRLTWVDFRAGQGDEEALNRLVAGVLGVGPGGPQAPARDASRLACGIIHPLPPAPVFVGRAKELDAVKRFWTEDDECHVLSLVGLGGAGKTAVIAEFLSSILSGEVPCPDGLFVWSFYVDQEVNNFLRAAYMYFGRGDEPEAAGTGLLYRLVESLTRGQRNLFILDGLERVQRPYSDHRGLFGELEDPLLRQVITRFVYGLGRAKCLITSRFPVSDLRPWRDRAYRALEIDQLAHDDARLLLRRHGVRGDDAAIDRVIEEYGAHALTLDHLGVYLTEFRGADAAQAHELPEPRIDSDIPQERKLARVFYAYEQSLKEAELDLLKRICIFRFGVGGETIFNLFAAGGAAHSQISGSLADATREQVQRLIARLLNLHLILRESEDQYTAHPAVRDHFYSLFTERELFHGAVERAFTEQIAFEAHDDWVKLYTTYQSLARAANEFREKAAEIASLPTLTADLLDGLRSFIREGKGSLQPQVIRELDAWLKRLEGENPGLPRYDINSAAVWNIGDEGRARWASLLELHTRWRGLWSWNRDAHSKGLANRKASLVNETRDFIRQHGGRLSRESVAQLEDFSKSLLADGDVPLMPTVRLNHAKLTLQPGVAHPTDPAVLDFIEELIYHSIKAGHVGEAESLYQARLGGLFHLGRTVGEYARGVRILRSFPVCPDRYDLSWYLRGTGDLEGALALMLEEKPIWAGSLLCLLGRLPAVMRGSYWNVAHVIAEFLSGRSAGRVQHFNATWGEAMIEGELHLIKGDLQGARRSEAVSTSPEQIRDILVGAEVERRSGQPGKAEAEIERAAPWVLRSASVEHLCLFHLVRGRLMLDRGEFEAADTELKEGVHLARTSKLALAHADLLNERGRVFLAMAKAAQAEGMTGPAGDFLEVSGRCALLAANGVLKDEETPASGPDLPLEELSVMGALHSECQYAWGGADALSLLGESLLRRNLRAEAREPLRSAAELYERLRDPRAEQARKMLHVSEWDS